MSKVDTPPTRQQMKDLAWLLDQRDRLREKRPETVHLVDFTFAFDNLWLAQLETMARLQGVAMVDLMHRYLALGFQADLNCLHGTQGARIGRTPRKP